MNTKLFALLLAPALVACVGSGDDGSDQSEQGSDETPSADVSWELNGVQTPGCLMSWTAPGVAVIDHPCEVSATDHPIDSTLSLLITDAYRYQNALDAGSVHFGMYPFPGIDAKTYADDQVVNGNFNIVMGLWPSSFVCGDSLGFLPEGVAPHGSAIVTTSHAGNTTHGSVHATIDCFDYETRGGVAVHGTMDIHF
jgi:hypothetical protein